MQLTSNRESEHLLKQMDRRGKTETSEGPVVLFFFLFPEPDMFLLPLGGLLKNSTRSRNLPFQLGNRPQLLGRRHREHDLCMPVFFKVHWRQKRMSVETEFKQLWRLPVLISKPHHIHSFPLSREPWKIQLQCSKLISLLRR